MIYMYLNKGLDFGIQIAFVLWGDKKTKKVLQNEINKIHYRSIGNNNHFQY